MDKSFEVNEYSILGHNIRLKTSDDKDKVSPDEVVTYVQSEIDKMKLMSGGLEDSQIAVLLMLRFASESLSLEKDFKESVLSLQKSAGDALKLVDQVVTTH
ncbi:MAG: cell division protein ZapA [Bdellovibrionota bacterium]|nr:cell division protein ZapA [Bdellovibrionota bacterium]|tara:strand:- start:393 stop:695 length:303 start_codon:yes stop_codon:yes gene_type:complete